MNQASMQVMIQASWQDIKPANTQEPSVLIHQLYTHLKGIQEPTEAYETMKKLFVRQPQCMPEIEAQYATFAQSARATITAQLTLPTSRTGDSSITQVLLKYWPFYSSITWVLLK